MGYWFKRRTLWVATVYMYVLIWLLKSGQYKYFWIDEGCLRKDIWLKYRMSDYLWKHLSLPFFALLILGFEEIWCKESCAWCSYCKRSVYQNRRQSDGCSYLQVSFTCKLVGLIYWLNPLLPELINMLLLLIISTLYSSKQVTRIIKLISEVEVFILI